MRTGTLENQTTISEHTCWKLIKIIETRKVMLPTNIFLKKRGALEACLNFEKYYILAKKQKSDFTIKSELNRLSIFCLLKKLSELYWENEFKLMNSKSRLIFLI